MSSPSRGPPLSPLGPAMQQQRLAEQRRFGGDRALPNSSNSPISPASTGSNDHLMAQHHSQPQMRHVSTGHRAAFLQGNDPSLRDDGTVNDLVRMRHDQAEFAPVKLSWGQSGSSSGHGSMSHLLGDVDGGSPYMSRSNSIASSIGGSSSDQQHYSSSYVRGRQLGTDALRKERPKTRYEDFEAGQSKLATTSHTQTYDIMPDIAVLLHNTGPEKDDSLHDPGQRGPRVGDDRRILDPKGVTKGSFTFLSVRGLLNAGALVLILTVLVTMFGVYPIVTNVLQATSSKFYTNSSGQIPDITGFRGLVDRDTPDNVLTRIGFDGHEYTLVFSDEFEQEGRTFNEGDDPYWTAIDSHYYATNNLEWYDPRAATTAGGHLVFNMSRQNPRTNHGFNYSSGMIQTWNQFCFTGGYIEVAVNLPGRPDVMGFWPGAWTMGNLGRAGYGATNYGTWPYSYDSCDVGVLHNQTDPETGGPPAALWSAWEGDKGLSYLPGQRLSACTCKGEDHPGPWLDDEKRYRGRAAPEIDILEAAVETRPGRGLIGTVSQSAQFAPFDAQYQWHNQSNEDFEVFGADFNAHINPYKGGTFQQSVSGLPDTDQLSYELLHPDRFQTYGFEYLPSMYGTADDVPFITWMQAGEKMWTLKEPGVRPNPDTQIGQRLISNEPMYAILNFGMSPNFGTPDLENLIFPSLMKIDYIRVYQRTGQINIGCDPPGYPTTDYIDKHIEAYTNANMTIWDDYTDAGFPKNRLIDTC